MTTPTCWACGSPWFEPDQFGNLLCCTCDADYSKTPASRRISAGSPSAVRLYDGTPFEGRLDGCRSCSGADRFDIYAPYSRELNGDQAICFYECDNGHCWTRGFARKIGTPPPVARKPQPKKTAPKKTAAKLIPAKQLRQPTFREHVRKQASENFVVARKILEDPDFPYLPQDCDAYVAYLRDRGLTEDMIDELEAFWDLYQFGEADLAVVPLHAQAKVLVETFRHYCVLTVNRDMLVDNLQLKWKVPAEAAGAEIPIPDEVRTVLEEFKPVTLAMFTRLQYRGPWLHDTGPRHYTIHVPIAYRQIAADAMAAAELGRIAEPLRALLDQLTVAAVDQTAIYQWFDGAGVPIYYGITKDMHSRQTNHARYGSWGVFSVSCKVVRADTRDDARALERELIERDRPIFNRQHNKTPEAYDRVVDYLTRHGRLDLLSSATPPKAKPALVRVDRPTDPQHWRDACHECGALDLALGSHPAVQVNWLDDGLDTLHRCPEGHQWTCSWGKSTFAYEDCGCAWCKARTQRSAA